MNEQLPITVGYDGSGYALAALRKGLKIAQQLGARLQIIRAWTISSAPRPKSWAPGYVPPVDDFAAEVAEQTLREITPLLEEYPDVKTQLITPHGAAGKELILASAQSQLIVVGTRGLGGFADLLLGSISGQVVEDAKCDVLVVKNSLESGS